MLKLAIIDDNYEFVETIYNYLNDKRLYNIQIIKIFSNGENALNYILKEDLDVILLDLNLPKIDGIKIIEILQKAKKNIKIITISGDSFYMDSLLKSNLKVYKKLVKPFNIDNLIFLLDEIESSKNDIRENIINLLDNFNFNKNTIGYLYIIECIEFCLTNNFKIMPRSILIYNEIAKMHNHYNSKKIGWNIDKTIKLMNEETNSNIKMNFLNNSMPSTKYFINCIIKRLNDNLYYKNISEC